MVLTAVLWKMLRSLDTGYGAHLVVDSQGLPITRSLHKELYYC
jgi:hypothetical protein